MDSEPPLDGPGEESQLYCKPVAEKAEDGRRGVLGRRLCDEAGAAAEKGASSEPIDVDADDASDDGGDDLDRFGRARGRPAPRRRAAVGRGRPRAGARGMVERGYENGSRTSSAPWRRIPPSRCRRRRARNCRGATVLGDDLEATVSFAAAPAPYLLLVADADAGAGGYRQLAHDAAASLVACGRGARRRARRRYELETDARTCIIDSYRQTRRALCAPGGRIGPQATRCADGSGTYSRPTTPSRRFSSMPA